MGTIIPDAAERFPICPTFGFVAEPNYLVKITSREGGYERRQRIWSRPLSKYTGVPFGDQPQADIEQILYFWHAMGGMWSGFRFKDWIDYKSCKLDEEPAVTDMPLIVTGDSPTSYRLLKQYAAGSTIQQREITRPCGSTIMIGNTLGAAQTDWTLNEATGVVTIGGSFVGTPGCWGGEFDVWVRFDAQFNPAVSNFNIMNVSVQLAEIRLPLA
jgi:uncharacterized protein (TIGR02217 family)